MVAVDGCAAVVGGVEMIEYKKYGDALTDPPVYIGWRDFVGFFGTEVCDATDLEDHHLTNYQAVIVKLHGTWESNKASAQANGELIKALRKKIKKAKRHLK